MRLRKLINRRRNQRTFRRNAAHDFGRRWPDKTTAGLGEAKFLDLINASSQGFLIHTFEFVPLFINVSYAEILGYTMEEVERINNIHHFYSLSEVPRLKGYLRERQIKQLPGESPTIYEVEALHKKGRKVVLQHAVSVIDWRGTKAVLVTVNDITEKYLAQQALEHNEQRFRDFAESASDWCWEMDADFRFTFISDSFERITGKKKEDILGSTRHEFAIKFMNMDRVSEQEIQHWKEHQQILKSQEPFTNFMYNWYRDDGSVVVMNTNGKPIHNRNGEFSGYRGAAKDITVETEMSEQLNFKATHDELTGLLNRGHFDNELHNAIDDAHIHNNKHVLVYMDLDRFKIVNDTCGHMAGDELLQQLARLFESIFRPHDILARLGGDEFTVIMPDCTIKQSVKITKNLHQAMDNFRFVWDEKTFSVGISVGVVAVDKNSESVSRILHNVDSACYMAKDTGRNKTQVFSENDADLSRRQGEMRWASRITQALEDEAFALHGQAIMPLQTSEKIFYELLIRMRDGDKLIAPNMFLPAAERYDLSLLVDKWVLRNALAWIANHPEILVSTKSIFINLSGKTIGQKNFLDFTIRLLKEYAVPPEKICFEITETAAITNLAEANRFICKLKNIGCFFALDDFGSGVSSYAYLKNLPVDYLKIDGMFVRDMCTNPVNMAMVKSINEISHVMGKKTIAEFVEDDAVFAVLRNMGVDYAQGYAVHRPEPIENLATNDVINRYRFR